MRRVLIGLAVTLTVGLGSSWALAETGAATPTKGVPVHQAVFTSDGPQADVQQVRYGRAVVRRGVVVGRPYGVYYGPAYGPSYRAYYGWSTPYSVGYPTYVPRTYYYSSPYPYYGYSGYLY